MDTKNITKEQLQRATAHSKSYRDLFHLLNLKAPSGASYAWMKSLLDYYDISVEHFSPYEKGKFSKICAESRSIAEVLDKMGLTKFGGNYATVRKKVVEQGIDISHWEGRNAPRESTVRKTRKGKTIPLADVLVENSNYRTSLLKSRLLAEGLIKNECFFLDCPTRQMNAWRGEKINYELDHINGVSNDHRLENLRLLCVMCHKQTPTYGSKNASIIRPSPDPICLGCGTLVSGYGRLCPDCSGKQAQKINWPSNEDLVKLVSETNLTQAATHLSGLNSNSITASAIKKRLKKNGLYGETGIRTLETKKSV